MNGSLEWSGEKAVVILSAAKDDELLFATRAKELPTPADNRSGRERPQESAMSLKIDPSVTTSVAASSRSKPAGASQAGVPARPAAPAATDSVRLTDGAQRLQQLHQALASTPDSDPQRIASVRQAIDNGSYTVDAGAVAARLTRLEWELSSS